MKFVDVKEIDFNKLKKYPSIGMNSKIYFYGNDLIKIYSELSEKSLQTMEKKMLLLDSLSLDFLIKPHTLIYGKGNLIGSIMQNHKGIPLEDYVKPNTKINVNTYLIIMKDISSKLKKLHEAGIIFQDLSGGNILISDDYKIKFCDIESCIYKNFDSPYISNLFRRYTNFHSLLKEKTYNSDRITLFLSFYYYLFTREIQRTSIKQYDNLSQQINTLKEMKTMALLLKDKTSNLENLPYLEEFIDENQDRDKYVITPRFSLF